MLVMVKNTGFCPISSTTTFAHDYSPLLWPLGLSPYLLILCLVVHGTLALILLSIAALFIVSFFPGSPTQSTPALPYLQLPSYGFQTLTHFL